MTISTITHHKALFDTLVRILGDNGLGVLGQYEFLASNDTVIGVSPAIQIRYPTKTKTTPKRVVSESGVEVIIEAQTSSVAVPMSRAHHVIKHTTVVIESHSHLILLTDVIEELQKYPMLDIRPDYIIEPSRELSGSRGFSLPKLIFFVRHGYYLRQDKVLR